MRKYHYGFRKEVTTEVTKHSDVHTHKISSGVTSVTQALIYHAGVRSETVLFHSFTLPKHSIHQLQLNPGRSNTCANLDIKFLLHSEN